MSPGSNSLGPPEHIQSIECEQPDSRPASHVESGFSSPRAASGLNSRRVCRDVRDARGGREVPRPPFEPDGTERPIHRPTDPEDQQDDYRGKQKGHTSKNLLVSDATCRMCFLSATEAGQAPEKSLAELEG
jgi:hypothetical protein